MSPPARADELVHVGPGARRPRAGRLRARTSRAPEAWPPSALATESSWARRRAITAAAPSSWPVSRPRRSDDRQHVLDVVRADGEMAARPGRRGAKAFACPADRRSGSRGRDGARRSPRGWARGPRPPKGGRPSTRRCRSPCARPAWRLRRWRRGSAWRRGPARRCGAPGRRADRAPIRVHEGAHLRARAASAWRGVIARAARGGKERARTSSSVTGRQGRHQPVGAPQGSSKERTHWSPCFEQSREPAVSRCRARRGAPRC